MLHITHAKEQVKEVGVATTVHVTGNYELSSLDLLQWLLIRSKV